MKFLNTYKQWVLIICLGLQGCAMQHKHEMSPTVHQQTLSFSTVNEAVENLSESYGTDEILIILDIDNTLLTSNIDLGGDIWYQWQTDQLTIKPTPEQKVSCLFTDAIGLLYELGPMDLIEQQVPQYIRSWQSAGHEVFALTSRAPDNRSATTRELAVHSIDFTRSPLTSRNNDMPVMSGQLSSPYSYIDGIMMTTGMNKGEMLQFLLNQTHRQFKAVVFVDDSESNIINMKNAYSATTMNMQLFHYTRVEHERQHKYGTILTQQQADQMAGLWSELNTTLNGIYPERASRQQTGCVGTGTN